MTKANEPAALACALLVALGGSGCALLGPASVRGSRSAYNDAIIATNNQQVLSMIVRMRYGEPTGLLAVSSVTANVNIQARAGAQFGVGPDRNYEGNLVPLAAGFAYEANPTITYTPVQGEQYMRQLLSPLPLDLTVLVLRGAGGSPQGSTLLLRSINGLRNPDFLTDPSVAVDPRFTRVVELLAQLTRQGRAHWTQDPREPTSLALALTGDGDAFSSQVAELYRALGFPPPRDLAGVVTLPVRSGVGRPEEPALYMVTRSLYELFGLAAASVEVPDEHVTARLADSVPPAGPAGASIRVRRAGSRPDDAVTAVRSHGWWYFIDGTDSESKLTFRILESLLSVRIADAADDHPAKPVLTVPVSR